MSTRFTVHSGSSIASTAVLDYMRKWSFGWFFGFDPHFWNGGALLFVRFFGLHWASTQKRLSIFCILFASLFPFSLRAPPSCFCSCSFFRSKCFMTGALRLHGRRGWAVQLVKALTIHPGGYSLFALFGTRMYAFRAIMQALSHSPIQHRTFSSASRYLVTWIWSGSRGHAQAHSGSKHHEHGEFSSNHAIDHPSWFSLVDHRPTAKRCSCTTIFASDRLMWRCWAATRRVKRRCARSAAFSRRVQGCAGFFL